MCRASDRKKGLVSDFRIVRSADFLKHHIEHITIDIFRLYFDIKFCGLLVGFCCLLICTGFGNFVCDVFISGLLTDLELRKIVQKWPKRAHRLQLKLQLIAIRSIRSFIPTSMPSARLYVHSLTTKIFIKYETWTLWSFVISNWQPKLYLFCCMNVY